MFIYWQASESVSDVFPTSRPEFSLHRKEQQAPLVNKEIDVKSFFIQQIWLWASIIKTCWLRRGENVFWASYTFKSLCLAAHFPTLVMPFPSLANTHICISCWSVDAFTHTISKDVIASGLRSCSSARAGAASNGGCPPTGGGARLQLQPVCIVSDCDFVRWSSRKVMAVNCNRSTSSDELARTSHSTVHVIGIWFVQTYDSLLSAS